MRTTMRRIHVWLGGALVLAVIAQFYFAGVGVFTFPGTPKDEFPKEEFALHSINGIMVIPLLSLLAVIVAALARAPGRTIALSAAPIGLVVVQVLVFILASVFFGESPADAPAGAEFWVALHVVNGLLILWVAIMIFRRARALAAADRTPSDLPAAATAQA